MEKQKTNIQRRTISMRKITSGMAALALCVSLSVPTFAATGYASGTVNRNDYTPSTTTTTTTNKTQTSTTNSTKAETQLSTSAVSKNIADAVKSGSTTATVKVKNAKTIDAATIKNVAAEAAKAGVNSKIHADQVVGGKVVARMYLDPAKAANLKGEINLSVNTDAESTKVATDTFKKYFNNEIAAVNLGQKGPYGMDVRIAVKVDLSKLNTENLNFFAYDRESNTYVKLTEPKYQIDANGYLHFDTSVGGDVIITDQALTAK